jgi:hypothetical protein
MNLCYGNARFESRLWQVLRDPSQFLQENAGILPRFDYDCFLSNPVQLIIHLIKIIRTIVKYTHSVHRF